MRRVLQLALLLAAAPVAAADVYKSVDANGTVVYSDRPVQGAERVQVDAPYVGGGPEPRQGLAASEPEPAEDAEQAAGSEPTAAERAEQRAQNCEIARERQERYATSHRLYRTTDSGERDYLSSAEIDEARAQAAADVDEWCG